MRVCNWFSPIQFPKFARRGSIATMWRAAVAVAALLVGMAPAGRGISLRQAARNREPSEVVPNYDDTRESNSPSWLPPVPSWEEQPWEGATIGGECTRGLWVASALAAPHACILALMVSVPMAGLPSAFHSKVSPRHGAFRFRAARARKPTRCTFYAYHSKHSLHPIHALNLFHPPSAGSARSTRTTPYHSLLTDPEIPPCPNPSTSHPLSLSPLFPTLVQPAAWSSCSTLFSIPRWQRRPCTPVHLLFVLSCAPLRTAPHRFAPHRTASHRTAPLRTAPHCFAPHRSSQAAFPRKARSTAPSRRLSRRPSPAGSTFRMAPLRHIPLRTAPCSRPTLAGWPR